MKAFDNIKIHHISLAFGKSAFLPWKSRIIYVQLESVVADESKNSLLEKLMKAFDNIKIHRRSFAFGRSAFLPWKRSIFSMCSWSLWSQMSKKKRSPPFAFTTCNIAFDDGSYGLRLMRRKNAAPFCT
jgi:hypothetical protein